MWRGEDLFGGPGNRIAHDLEGKSRKKGVRIGILYLAHELEFDEKRTLLDSLQVASKTGPAAFSRARTE